MVREDTNLRQPIYIVLWRKNPEATEWELERLSGPWTSSIFQLRPFRKELVRKLAGGEEASHPSRLASPEFRGNQGSGPAGFAFVGSLKIADVDHIPGEDDVDPEVLERKDPQTDRFGQDYRDSNSDSGSSSITGSTQSLKQSFVLAHWRHVDGEHILLKNAATEATICEWHGATASRALSDGTLDRDDMHGSAVRFAKKAGLIVRRALEASYVDPSNTPAWEGFLKAAKTASVGSGLVTEDGASLTKMAGDRWRSKWGTTFLLADLQNARAMGLPAMRIAEAEKSFVGQHKDDGSWTVKEVETAPEATAAEVSEAPDGNKGHALKAPDAEAAAEKLHDHMKSDGVKPVDRDEANAHPRMGSVCIKVLGGYIAIDQNNDPTVVKSITAASAMTRKSAQRWVRTLPALGHNRNSISLV